MRCGKRTQWLWICGLIGSLVIGFHVPSFAAGLQSTYNPDELTTAAGKEFYFTFFDHWNWNGLNNGSIKSAIYSISAIEDANIKITYANGGSKFFHMNAGESSVSKFDNPDYCILQGAHISSTGNLYVHMWAHGGTSSAETVILPKKLLGTNYMLQGAPGSLIEDKTAGPIRTYSQFTIVGTKADTHIEVTPLATTLQCVTTGSTIGTGHTRTFTIGEKDVLLFQADDYTNDISGTMVKADKPIAIFQGNNLTRIWPNNNWSDFVWEQARPVDQWGQEFIVAKSSKLLRNYCQITAAYDDTEVYQYKNGVRSKVYTLSAGYSYVSFLDDNSGDLQTLHFYTSKPTCCYLYTTGSTENNDIGDPAMAEIIPVDHMASESRWIMISAEDNAPYTTSIVVTTKTEDEAYIKYNNTPLKNVVSGENVKRKVTDGYVTYEIPSATNITGKLTAERGGYSAYILRTGKTAEASLLNIGLPFTPEPPEPLCTEGMLLFREDFGGNDPNDPEVSTTPVPGMSYTQLKSNAFGGMGSGKYLVTKKGYRNSSNSNYSVWHIMDDHTYFDDYSRGYFMEIDGKGDNSEFYKTTLDGLCAGSKLTFSAWVANLTTAGQYNVWRYDRAYVHPKLTFSIVNKDTREVIAEYQTDTIAHDWSLFGVSNAWQHSANWQQVGMNFIVPEGVNAVELSIRNAVNSNAAGNDFAIDDIEIRICLPEPFILAPDTVCIDSKYTMEVQLQNDSLLPEPREYRWFYSADSVTWTAIPNSNTTRLKRKAKVDHTGWYQVAVAAPGGAIENENCRATSEPFHLYVIPDCPPVLCEDGILLFREDFGGNSPSDPRISTTPVPGMSYRQLTDDRFGSMRSGSYLITKSGYCNGDTTSSNQPQNRRSQWHLQDDHTYPGDYTRGYFMEIDGMGDNNAFYTTTIDGLCVGIDLSFIAYVANVMTWGQYIGSPGRYAYPRLRFVLTEPTSGRELAAYETGEIPFDSTFIGDYSCWKQSSKWNQVGMNFTVPDGVEAITLTIYNNCRGTIGNDFAIDDIEIRLCLDPVYVSGTSPACRKKQQTLWATYDNWGTILSPEYQWYYANDSIGPYAAIEGETKNYYRIPIVHKSHEGWYRVAVAEEGHTADENCRSVSEPFHLETKYCDTYTEQQIDTTVCDTLLTEPYTWRGHIWNSVGTLTDTIKDFEDDDSVYVHLYMHDKQCCPDIQTIYVDSAVCDTLLPFLWMYRDTMLLFERPGSQEVEVQHAKWENCVGTVYTLTLDTFHCERLYPIIVNKYNWQLLLDNVTLRRLFPDRTARSYQWYKDDLPIPGANDDDYSEQNELHGVFQLRVTLDGNEHVWSNILEILDTQAPEPIVKKVYYWHGLTIIRFQQGDKVWVEKILRIEK